MLRPGDDMTRITFPSELCHPFSMLELISFRQLSYFHVLFDVNKASNEEERFIAALKWLISLFQAEEMHKKPFNPVIGERHVCWVDNNGDNHDEDWTEFISEQVSHHPPISSFFIRNSKEKVQMEGNLKFGVQFGGNYAGVTTAGPVSVKTAIDSYTLDKCIPNMVIQNVVWGTKYVMWDGDITLACPNTGYSATITLSEVDPTHNRVEGYVYKNESTIYRIEGQCGVLVEMWKESDDSEKIVMFNKNDSHVRTITYPPESALVEMDSIRLWRPPSDAIIANDLQTADAEKVKIENSQRTREKARKEAGLPYHANYFTNVDSSDEGSANWKVKDEVKVNKAFLDKLKEQASEEAAKRAEEEENKDPEVAEEEEGCRIQ